MRLCQNARCNNKALKDRKECGSCRHKRYKREKNGLLKVTYHQLKSNAKHRGISFKITLKQWKEFCAKHNYLMLKGTGPDDMTVERPNPLKGYEPGNMTVLPMHENARKGTSDRRILWSKVSVVPREPGDPF